MFALAERRIRAMSRDELLAAWNRSLEATRCLWDPALAGDAELPPPIDVDVPDPD